MLIIIIVAFIVFFVLALQIVKAGAYADWRVAKIKCSQCKFFEETSKEQREIFCLLKGWQTTDEVLVCDDGSKR